MARVRNLPAIFEGAPGAYLLPDHLLRTGAPVEEGVGPDFVATKLLEPLEAALPEHELRVDLTLAGHFDGAAWRAWSGHLIGLFAQPLWGVPSTERLVWMRFGCFEREDADGRVAETLLLFDLLSLMRQAGCWPLIEPPGPDPMAPAPQATDGNAAESLARVEAMIAGLMRFDGRDLASMGMRDHWVSQFNWFGPAPIGSFRGHRDYERGHQGPFLRAFPDRVGGNHRARIAEGALVASTGWPSIRATHRGDGWLGLAATGRAVTMRVMDFWAVEGDRITDNWVMIDLIDLLAQLGVDLFDAGKRSGTDG